MITVISVITSKDHVSHPMKIATAIIAMLMRLPASQVRVHLLSLFVLVVLLPYLTLP